MCFWGRAGARVLRPGRAQRGHQPAGVGWGASSGEPAASPGLPRRRGRLSSPNSGSSLPFRRSWAVEFKQRTSAPRRTTINYGVRSLLGVRMRLSGMETSPRPLLPRPRRPASHRTRHRTLRRRGAKARGCAPAARPPPWVRLGRASVRLPELAARPPRGEARPTLPSGNWGWRGVGGPALLPRKASRRARQREQSTPGPPALGETVSSSWHGRAILPVRPGISGM